MEICQLAVVGFEQVKRLPVASRFEEVMHSEVVVALLVG